MCSILGVLGKTVSPETLQACFARTASRGPDTVSYTHLVARDAKTARGHLLDGGVARRAKALGQFAALAAVGFAVQMVHGQRHALVRFPRNGACLLYTSRCV